MDNSPAPPKPVLRCPPFCSCSACHFSTLRHHGPSADHASKTLHHPRWSRFAAIPCKNESSSTKPVELDSTQLVVGHCQGLAEGRFRKKRSARYLGASRVMEKLHRFSARQRWS